MTVKLVCLLIITYMYVNLGSITKNINLIINLMHSTEKGGNKLMGYFSVMEGWNNSTFYFIQDFTARLVQVSIRKLVVTI